MSPAIAVSALWTGWLLAWTFAARTATPTVAALPPSAHLAHTVLLWCGAALVFLPRSLVPELSASLLHAGWIAWGGAMLIALGLAFAGWARARLGRLWSASIGLKEGHALVRAGPYALCRHPIYAGLLVAMIGTALARGTASAIVGLVVFAIGLLLRIRQEERLLLGHFGDVYRRYRADVPALVPRAIRGLTPAAPRDPRR